MYTVKMVWYEQTPQPPIMIKCLCSRWVQVYIKALDTYRTLFVENTISWHLNACSVAHSGPVTFVCSCSSQTECLWCGRHMGGLSLYPGRDQHIYMNNDNKYDNKHCNPRHQLSLVRQQLWNLSYRWDAQLKLRFALFVTVYHAELQGGVCVCTHCTYASN